MTSEEELANESRRIADLYCTYYIALESIVISQLEHSVDGCTIVVIQADLLRELSMNNALC